MTATVNRKRVLVISFSTHWTYHFGTELELLSRHVHDDCEVHLLYCNSAITACQTNPHGDLQKCNACKMLREHALDSIRHNIHMHTLDAHISSDDKDEALLWLPDEVAGREVYRESFRDADLGWGVVSSTASITRDPSCNSSESVALLKNFSTASALTYMATSRFLSEQSPFDIAYIFNGRFATMRAAWRACQSHQLPDIRLHERGCDKNHYDIFNNTLPHSISAFKSNVNETWKFLSDTDRQKFGNKFFTERRAGNEAGWVSFTVNQTLGLLPDDWKPSGNKLVVFSSSEDEFVAIGDEWTNRCFDTQQEAIESVSTLCREKFPDLCILVREHPNAAKSRSRLLESSIIKSNGNCKIIYAESPIDSYALIDFADIVLTFGSTIGVEATYWGKPSITLGPSFGRGLDVTWEASTLPDLLNLLNDPPPARPKQNAIKYGAYLATRGTRFEYFQPTSLFEGTFNKTRLSTRLLAINTSLRLAHLLSSVPLLPKIIKSKYTIILLQPIITAGRPILSCLKKLRRNLPFQ